jgi:hypothetical protein
MRSDRRRARTSTAAVAAGGAPGNAREQLASYAQLGAREAARRLALGGRSDHEKKTFSPSSRGRVRRRRLQRGGEEGERSAVKGRNETEGGVGPTAVLWLAYGSLLLPSVFSCFFGGY